MIKGAYADKSASRAMAADEKLLAAYSVPAGMLAKLTIWADGLGGGAGEQPLRAVVYDELGALLAVGDPVLVSAGTLAGWLDLPLPQESVPGGKTIVGVQAGAPGGVARVYGSAPLVNLLTNPSGENGTPPNTSNSTATATPVNQVTNPNAESGTTTGWAPRPQNNDAGHFVATSEIPARFRTQCFKMTRDTDGGGADSIYADCGSTSSGVTIAVTPGQFVAARGSFRAATNGRNCRVRLIFVDSGGVQIGSVFDSAIVVDTTTGWIDLSVISGAAPANTVKVLVRMNIDGVPEGESHYFDAVVAVVSATLPTVVPPYFDGSMTGFKWNGAANASTSQPAAATAVDATSWSRFGTHSGLFTITRDDGAAVIARVGSGAAATPVVPNHYVAVRVSSRLATLYGAAASLDNWRGRIYWYKADGTASATTVTDGSLTLSPVVGSTGDFFLIAQVPADAAFGAPAMLFDMPSGLTVIQANVDAYMLVDLTAAYGAGWTPSGVGAATVASEVPGYFDGDMDDWLWLGAAQASQSAAGRLTTDAYADGPNATLGTGGAGALRLASYVTTIEQWVPPVIPDDELAALGWPSAQKALSGVVQSATAQTVGMEWHGTLLDPHEGAFAVVRAGGALEEMVGQRLRVTLGRRAIFVYVVDSADELEEDLSLARRAWLALANLSDESRTVRVEVVGATPS